MGVMKEVEKLLRRGYEPVEVVRMGYAKSTVYRVYREIFGPRRPPSDKWIRKRIIKTLKELMERIDLIEKTLTTVVLKQRIMDGSIEEIVDGRRFVRRRRGENEDL